MRPSEAERRAWLRLMFTPGLGPAGMRALLNRVGLPQALFDRSSTVQALASLVGPDLAQALRNPLPEPARALVQTSEQWLDTTPGAFLVTAADADYPSTLLDLADPPLVLFGLGRRELLGRPSIAMVGSRSATRQGEATAREFARHLARAGLVVCSGLARGIDAHAHLGALDAEGDTLALVGTGLDIVYPEANAPLAAQMATRGLILSEFAPGTPPRRENFPRRNRLIAGLSLGVLVVEAALRSGSLITARLAGDLGREVFAVPGSIHSPMARGCHRLIREGAKLVECGQDILEELRLPAPAPNGSSHESLFQPTQEQAHILAHLGFEPTGVDALICATGLDVAAISAGLLELELIGAVEALSGNRYQRVNVVVSSPRKAG